MVDSIRVSPIHLPWHQFLISCYMLFSLFCSREQDLRVLLRLCRHSDDCQAGTLSSGMDVMAFAISTIVYTIMLAFAPSWQIIDTINGANGSAIIYSIAETAKANNLKSYEYFEYLLMEISKHVDEQDRSFLEDLLSWSPKLSQSIPKLEKEISSGRE